MVFHGGEWKRFYNDVTTWWLPSSAALGEMCETSLLQIQPATETVHLQDHQAGRYGAVLKPLRLSHFAQPMAYEIANHYRPPLPRL